MSESISLTGLIVSLLLPWIVGSVWVYWLLRKSARWNVFVVLGQGYVLGIFLTTVATRLWDAAGLPLSFWGIAGVLVALSVIGLFLLRTQTIPERKIVSATPMEKWQLAAVTVISALIAYRQLTIFQEILLRPLYPWDAWMNWAPKAVIWFHDNQLTPFISPTEWLNSTAEPVRHTLGAGAAWKYPPTVPLIQLWGMLGAGTDDHTAINLPWLMGVTALGLALYGHLRLSGASVLCALVACYALLNLPYINVQTMLAGYADIWVAVVFGCAIFALHEWHETRQWSYAALAVILALMCTQLKVPGLIMGGIVLLVFLTSVIRLPKAAWYGVLVSAALVAAATVTVGIDITIPGLGRVAASTDSIVLPYIGRYSLEYHAIHSAMASTLLLMLNWSLLWYAFGALAVMWIFGRRTLGTSSYVPSPELRALILTLVFIFFVYYFTSRFRFAQDFTQINRALIYSIPVMVFYLFGRVGRA
jgi:hypothetical protein